MWGATLPPRDIAVTENYIAATDPDYEYLWIVNRKTHELAATIRVDQLPLQYVSELRSLRVEVADLLIQTDPASVLAGKVVYTARDRLPYAVPSSEYRVERLLPMRMPGRGRQQVWKRVLLPPTHDFRVYAYDLTDSRLLMGEKSVSIAKKLVDIGEHEDWADAIVNTRRDTLYVPFSSGGKSGLTVVNYVTGEKVEEFSVDSDSLGSRGSVSPDGGRLYLVFEDLWVIDLKKRVLVHQQPLGDDMYAIAAALSPDGDELYLLEATGRFLQARDAYTYEVLWNIALPRF